MEQHILFISERGQLTIPKQIRDLMSVKHFICTVEGTNIVLKPLQTREDFLSELDEAEQDWKRHGGLTLKQMKKKYQL